MITILGNLCVGLFAIFLLVILVLIPIGFLLSIIAGALGSIWSIIAGR